LCHIQSARAAGEVGRICAELVYGYTPHPKWEDDCSGACCTAQPKVKAGPCVTVSEPLTEFAKLRTKVDSCLSGIRLAKDRAADALSKVMIPEALDYPM
jgi:hypothetical protein